MAIQGVVWDDEIDESLTSKGVVWDDQTDTGIISQKPDDVIKEELSLMDKVRGGVEAFNQGTTLGFGDEIVGGSRALLDKALSSDYDFGEGMAENDRTFGDEYRMYRDDQRKAKKDFADEHGKTAMALELLGGVASPINLVGPGLQAAKGASALKAAGTLGLRGAAEGAIAGVGTADELEDVSGDALKGGLIGGAFGGTLGGLGRGLTSRKVTQDVMKKGADAVDKVPLHMIDADTNMEKGIASTYRNVFGRVPGSAGVLKRQEAPLLEAAQKQADDVLHGLGRRKDALDLAERRTVTNAGRVLAKSLNKVDDDLIATQTRMRSQQAAKTLPDYVPKEVRQELSEESDPRAVIRELKKFWGRDGQAFQSVKSQKFEADDNLVRMLSDEFPDEGYDELLGKNISGEFLMELRNRPAMKANKATGSVVHQARKDTAKFDKQIRRLLKENGTGTKFYDADIKAYGDYAAYRDAVDKADDLDGFFTGAHLAKTGSKAARREGSAKGQALGAPVRRQERGAKALKDEAKAKARSVTSDPARKAELKQAKKLVDEEITEARRGLSETKAKGVSQNVTFPSQLATAAALGAATPFTGAGVPAALAASRGLVSEGGQRAVAGQSGLQSLFNTFGEAETRRLTQGMTDQEIARLTAQLLRQSGTRMAAGD